MSKRPARQSAKSSKPPKFVGLRIDVETKSSAEVKRGPYVYTEDPDFGMLLIAYSPIRQYVGGARSLGKVRLLDISSPVAVNRFTQIITDPAFEKHAFNANFERITLSKWVGLPNGTYIDPENWRCSAIKANTAGIFGTLDEVARAVRSPIKKDPLGKSLIKFFSVPMKPREQKAADASCGCQVFHRPDAHPKEFAQYGEYNKQDVVTEALVDSQMPDPGLEVWREYEADQRINDRGFRHFKGLSVAALAQVAAERDRLMGDLKVLTGLDNPNSNTQMQGWLTAQGYPMSSLDKAHREEAAVDPLIPAHVAHALDLKGAASLSSVTKHKAALDTRCQDGRIRGSLRFYGAHTGREAGRGIQPQNLPRAEASAVDRTRLIRGLAYRDAPEIAKGTVRASIVPARDHVFIIFDYNSIEARVLAGLAGEQWAEAEFRGEGKIYEATCEQMFPGVTKRAIVDALKLCGKCGHCSECRLRARGKVSNLALGYAGGAGALVTMGAEKEGIDIGNYKMLHAEWEALGKPGKFHEWERDRHDYPELIRLRDAYREASPATVRFWKLCAKAWDLAATGKPARFGQNGMLTFMRDGRHNRLVLPSGRSIWYRFAQSHLETTKMGDTRVDRRTFIGKAGGIGHMRVDTHGGKLTENVTQAVARDILFDLIMRIEAMTAQGWPGRIVLHVHDEVVLEVHKSQAQQVYDDVEGMMNVAPSWGSTFIVKGEGSITERYRK